jgi:hypothetical protein
LSAKRNSVLAGTPDHILHSLGMAHRRSYNQDMPRPIRINNSRPATVRETAKILGVSKRRTDELVRLVEQTIYRNAKTGQFVIRAKSSGTIARSKRPRNASTKVNKAGSIRVKAQG